MNEFKIGDWVTDSNDNETFVILKIDDYYYGIAECPELSYYDIYYAGHIVYHCHAAKQKDIELACAEMLNLEFKL
jgi:hypothetical protein